MVHFTTFSSFYSFIETLKKDSIEFKIIGHSYDYFSGMYSNKKPDDNKWAIKLVAFSSIGSFYCSESVKLDDQEKIIDIKNKLITLPIAYGEVNYKDGIVSIK